MQGKLQAFVVLLWFLLETVLIIASGSLLALLVEQGRVWAGLLAPLTLFLAWVCSKQWRDVPCQKTSKSS